MGSVYRARDMHFPNAVKLVAVKEMINNAADLTVRKSIVETFEREANILVTLSHPAIPRIFDYFTYDERSYLVLEYVNGKDLEALLSETQGMFSQDQVIAWAIELCDVLEYLHGRQPEAIIFRDMKPSNVMVNAANHIVLVDFGIAKIFRAGQRGTMVGTEGYSPPEQYRGEASVQADLYALGATLHHLLTRRDPRLEAPFTFSERPIRQINPMVSAELEAVINTALKYNPQERFPSAQAMKEALMMIAHKSGTLNRVAVRTAHFGSDAGIKPLWMYECEDEIRGSPLCENDTIFIGSYDNNLYALSADKGEFRWKSPTEGGVITRPLSIDGRLLFGSEDGKFYAVTAQTGKVLWDFPVNAPVRCSASMIDRRVVFGADNGVFYALNLENPACEWRVETGGPIRSTPVVAQDQLFFGNEEGEFYCLDAHGQMRWRFNSKRGITASPLIDRGAVYFPSLDSIFYALDARSGWVIWRFRMGKGSVSSPCKSENMLYTGSADGNIYCVEPSSGREVWRFKAEHQVSGSPIIYKDCLYCGSADGTLYCLENRSGRLRWKFTTGGAITGTPCVYNGILYVGSSDHYLYAFEA